MDKHSGKLVAVAQAEDTYDLLNHIAWTDVVRPRLEKEIANQSSILIAEALGTPIAGGRTREQVAGLCYGIKYLITLLESIMTRGEKALEELNAVGVSLKS